MDVRITAGGFQQRWDNIADLNPFAL